MAINPQMQDKYLALFASTASIVAYMVTVWMGRPDEFLKNIALLFAGAFVALLKTGASIDASPRSGNTNIINKGE
jgi:hypothetical protein